MIDGVTHSKRLYNTIQTYLFHFCYTKSDRLAYQRKKRKKERKDDVFESEAIHAHGFMSV